MTLHFTLDEIPAASPELIWELPAIGASLGAAAVDEAAMVASASTATSTSQAEPDWKKFGLWAVLLLSVVFLAAMAFSLLRKSFEKS
ncbi:DUF3999 family protein [Pseudomonas sp. Ant30-3]|uniref:DUF3999 family protein n=1 Tax=Pseudomonas sp. Ant30-3 TaxID=1488328 RepID=UPI0004920FFA